MTSIQKSARIAGFLYLLACAPAPFALLYVPGRLMVPGDAAATADRVRASESLLRAGMAAELLSATLGIVAILALYRLFRGVDDGLARAMAVLFLLSVPISYVNVLNDVAALMFAKGSNALAAIPAIERDAWTWLFLRLHNTGVVIAQILWGLWLIPYGRVVIRSRFIPPVLGVLVMIAGLGFVVSSVTALLLPSLASLGNEVGMILGIGEFPIILWYLIWGAREPPVVAPAAA